MSGIVQLPPVIVVEDLLERERKALREILEFLVPEQISISWDDITKGYSKQRTIERIMKAAENNSIMTSLRLRTVYIMLNRCYTPKIEV